MKRMEKLKNLFKEMPKPVLVLFVLLVVMFVGLFVLFFMPGNKENKARFFSNLQNSGQGVHLTSLRTNNTSENAKNGSEVGTPEKMIKELQEKEKKFLIEKKKYFQEVKSEEKSEEKSEGKNERKSVDLTSLPPPPPPPPSYAAEASKGEVPGAENVDLKPPYLKYSEEFHKAVLSNYARQPRGNVLLYKKEKIENNETAVALGSKAVIEMSKTGGSADIANINIVPGKFYKAVIINSVTSASGGNSFVLAELQDVKGAVLYGQIRGLIDETNRLDVVFDRLVYKGKTYSVKGIAFSLDRNQGIVSHVKYNVLKKIFLQGSLAFGESMTNALREDETETISSLWGYQTSQRKSPNRFKEGILAGSSSALGEAKRITQGYYQQIPDKTVILEKGTPILVFFM